MFGTLGTILLIVSLVFGGTGLTVAAAQGSMPDQPLYQIKLISENVRAGVTSGSVNRLHLALELAERRSEEMQTMFHAGQALPQAVQNRWEGELEEALQLAAGLTLDPQFQAHLEKIQAAAQVQQQGFEQVGPQKDPAGEALLTRTRAKLDEVLMLCKQGQQDPIAFQKKVQAMVQEQARDGEQAGDQNQAQKQEQNGEQGAGQNQEQEQNGRQAGDQNLEPNREQNQEQEFGPNGDCSGGGHCGPSDEGHNGPVNGTGPGEGSGQGGGPGDGSTGSGSGSADPGSDNTGGSYSGPGSTGSDNTGGTASGSEGNGGGEAGGQGGGGNGGGSGGGGK